jgi:hypothetical protein
MPRKLSLQQRAEIRALVARGVRRYLVAAEYGVSVSTIHNIVGRRTGIGGRPPKPPEACALCGSMQSVVRFNLHVPDKQHRSSRGAGSLCLCELCWARHAARNRLVRKKLHPAA